MKAEVSENFDLILRWEDKSRCEIVWTACSSREFDVVGKLWFPPGLNYQGPTRLEFSTTCYAWELRCFAEELEAFVGGEKESFSFSGSQDMTISLKERRGQADVRDRTVRVCELTYEMMRDVDLVFCSTEFQVVLGRVEDAKGTARAIREVIGYLKMDDSLDAQ